MCSFNVTRLHSICLDRHTHAQHSSPYQRYYNSQHSPPCFALNSRSYSLYALACDNRTVWTARYWPFPGLRMLGASPNGMLYPQASVWGSLIVFHHFTCTWSRETWSYVLYNWKLMFCRYLSRGLKNVLRCLMLFSEEKIIFFLALNGRPANMPSSWERVFGRQYERNLQQAGLIFVFKELIRGIFKWNYSV